MNRPTYPFLDQVEADQIRGTRVLLFVTQVNYPNPLPCLDLIPQGPTYAAGSLKAHGHSVQGVCTNYDISGEPAPQVLKRRLAEGIRAQRLNVEDMSKAPLRRQLLKEAVKPSVLCRT